MTNTILFKAINQYGFETYPKPYPAVQNIPDWFMKAPAYAPIEPGNPDGKKMLIGPDGQTNANYKKCTPMRDAMASGYIIGSWADVLVTPPEIEGERPMIQSRTQQQTFEPHSDGSIPPPPGYSKWVYKFANTWIPIVPKGYSILITPPMGHYDLPFYALPAIIDADTPSIDIAPPMFIKEGFSGIIERETPLFQVTPFKRDAWKSEFGYYEPGEFELQMDKTFNATLVNHYVKKIWKKKSYK